MSIQRKIKRQHERAKKVSHVSLVENSPRRAFEAGKEVALVTSHVSLSVEMLVGVMQRVFDPYIWMQSLPEKWQPDLMRAFLISIGKAERRRLDSLLWEAIGFLRDAVTDARHFHERNGDQRPFDPDFLFENSIIQIADELRLGVRDLLDGTDNGKKLVEAIEKYLTSSMRDQVEAMKDAAPLKREKGATPLIQYILDETNRLGQLHGLKTRGQKVEKFLEELKQSPAVQSWIQTPIRDRGGVYEQSIEVQAYDRFDGLTRTECNDALKDMEKNERRRAG